ncbi:acylphosphatase [Rhodocyclaceae bacterium SMB388]
MPDRIKDDEPVTRHLLIHGKVQGVWYRASAQNEALKLGLHGWVRNRSGGEVEALVSGPTEAVEAFIDWTREGPPAARVDRVEVSVANLPAPGPFSLRPDV